MSDCENTMLLKLKNFFDKYNLSTCNPSDYLQNYREISVVDAGSGSEVASPQPLVDDTIHSAIKFDLIADRHKDLFEYTEKHRTNDAFFISANERVFIEFKSGAIFDEGVMKKKVRRELREKNYTSLLFAMDAGWISSVEDSRQNVRYILVYSSQNPPSDLLPSKNEIRQKITQMAGEEEIPSDLEPMRWMFCNLSMCSEQDFIKNFIQPRYSAA